MGAFFDEKNYSLKLMGFSCLCIAVSLTIPFYAYIIKRTSKYIYNHLPVTI